MSLIAIAGTTQFWDEEATQPVAALSIAGQTLLERQVYQYFEAGADQVIVYVGEWPEEMKRLANRMCSKYAGIRIVDKALHLESYIRDSDRVIVMDEGMLLSTELVAGIAQCSPNTIAAWRTAKLAPREAVVLDSKRRYGGIALYSGQFVCQIAAELGEYSLQQTLLHNAESHRDVTYFDMTDFESGIWDGQLTKTLLWRVVEAPDSAKEAESWLFSSLHSQAYDLPSFLTMPLNRIFLIIAARLRLTPTYFTVINIILFLLVTFSFISGWFMTGLWSAVVMGFVQPMIKQMAQLRFEAPTHYSNFNKVIGGLKFIWPLVAAFPLSIQHGLVVWALAMIISFAPLVSGIPRALFENLELDWSLMRGNAFDSALRFCLGCVDLMVWAALIMAYLSDGAWVLILWVLAVYSLVSSLALTLRHLVLARRYRQLQEDLDEDMYDFDEE